MTKFYLIRHGNNDTVGHRLAARQRGIHLNDEGRRQAVALAEKLSREPICAVFTSPLERCRETAEPIAAKRGLTTEISDALLEVNFGEWTGRTFAEMESVPQWKQWNAFRSGHRIPGGETMLEIQSRVVNQILAWRRDFSEKTVALVSHGDPLRSALCYFLGMPLDFLHRIELGPASVSILNVDDWGAQVLCVNERAIP